ncbi:replication initiation protein [uncultured Corynebacterium sp.]|uniref:replication initiation protein n=1 Tax=uncultured Corynebacterium sp. TaxID=159447 RepID=UPI002596A82A|nr:replication initiation protein [uncultured Corynebacterium sp.]
MSIPKNGSDVPSWDTDQDTTADHFGQVVDPFTGLDALAELTGVQAGPPQSGTRSPQQRSALAGAARLLVENLGAVPTSLQSCGVTDADRSRLTAHLGRVALQGCPTRDFKAAWRKNAEGQSVPKMYRVGHPSLHRMQYIALTHAQYAAVVVIDVDRQGSEGGRVENINPEVHRILSRLAGSGAGPAWVGVNPDNGKAQLIWLIDPVHADASGDSPNMRLLKATGKTLGTALGGDPAFAHNLSRSPLYTGGDPTAYRWHCQHHRIDRLADLIEEVRTMTGETAPRPANKQQRFSSGRELIEAVTARRAEAQAFKALAADLAGELPDASAMDSNRIDGVKVLWLSEGRAARDETAFRHALATAHQLRAAGKRMSDAAIIDAYEKAYNVAQAVGADNRAEDMPPMRDRQTMARRVRGYVTSGKTTTGAAGGFSTTASVNSRERKALATMGRKGGKKAARRWQDDPDGDYARSELEKLGKANQRRKTGASANKFAIASWFMAANAETGAWPSIPEAMTEFGVSRDTVKRSLRIAGIRLPRGRRSTSD